MFVAVGLALSNETSDLRKLAQFENEIWFLF